VPLDRNPVARLPYGHRVVLRGVHAFPPVPGRLRQWRTSFHELTRWVHRTRGPVVLAGDFNASVDHPGMRELLAGGLRDAHEAAGAGRPPTWPHGSWVPAFVQLDHVLVRGVDVDSADETRIPGTDHDAVIVDLVVPVHTRSRS
jgi:endonuclease/exonuclease/phosphatase (EEP) superfamily protein YafD